MVNQKCESLIRYRINQYILAGTVMQENYSSILTGFESRPSPSISMTQLSPSARNFGGLRCIPTPPGVPVRITSPALSVQICETQLMMNGMSKIKNFVFESCILSSPIQDLGKKYFLIKKSVSYEIFKFDGSTSVATTGPSGQKVSNVFPKSHCPPLRFFCQSRPDTSLAIV